MEDRIDKIRELIKEKFERIDWQYHILPVIKYAKELARIYKVNEETTELAALLHDIGRIDLKNDENHHILGSKEAEKILKDFDYDEEIIKEIKHSIESHRGIKSPKPVTTIARIIANADAMAHFDIVPVLFYWRGTRNQSLEEVIDWADKKVERDWNKKITLPEAKQMVEEKYKAIRLLIDSLKEYK